jgi:hypothetical protein
VRQLVFGLVDTNPVDSLIYGPSCEAVLLGGGTARRRFNQTSLKESETDKDCLETFDLSCPLIALPDDVPAKQHHY